LLAGGAEPLGIAWGIRVSKVATAVRQISATPNDLMIGQSAGIVELRDMIARVARSSASVMITGPSGSGKELVARAIHAASDRYKQPFVALNCGAIPSELIESELFGHERGSFTGANARRIGRFEEADGGTLFLDEIGDMRFDMQVKLLRVLEDGIVTRIGGNAMNPVNVRVISATHQNIDTAIAENRFREDLFFRLGVVLLNVPDLASRVEDIPSLVANFQKKAGRPGAVRFSGDALERLMLHNWPGNVRELRNVVERAEVLFAGEVLARRDVEQLLGLMRPTPHIAANLRPIPTEVVKPPVAPQPTDDLQAPRGESRIPVDLKALLETLELEKIQLALDMADGVISEAARLLTLKRTTLIEKMRKYGVDRLA
jgi:sigma-54 dependent transcriptional regulator, flagellar regulatory protein